MSQTTTQGEPQQTTVHVYGDMTVTVRPDPDSPYRWITTVEDEEYRAQTSEQVEELHEQGRRHADRLAA